MDRIYRRRHQKHSKKNVKKSNKNNNVDAEKYETIIPHKYDLAMDETGIMNKYCIYVESIKSGYNGLAFTT